MLAGKIASVLVVAFLLTLIATQWIAWRFRAAMVRLMRQPEASVASSLPGIAPAAAAVQRPAPLAVSPDDNQRANQRLIAAFLGLTLLMALTRTLILLSHGGAELAFHTIAPLGAAYAWPVVPVIAVLQRWPRWRLVLTLLAWFVAAVLLLTWRTNDNISLPMVFGWLLVDIGLPLFAVTALCLGGATRAIGPWLMPIFCLLCWSSLAGVDLLAMLVDRQSPLVQGLVSVLPVALAIPLFALAPWLIAWWPLKALGRWIAAAYARRQLSELLYLFATVWVIAITGSLLGAIAGADRGGWQLALPLLWILPGAWVIGRLLAPPPGTPPTLLVLRVFQQDANVQALFDTVIERWRVSGNTILIAGTDLLDRTTDPDDIFTFLDGRLGERFIGTPADLPARLAGFEWQADRDGRYRINECYCRDHTWKQALAALVQRADLVLMDLRNFKSHNAGCLHELRELAAAPALHRVVVLTNAHTDLDAARQAAQGPDGRFVWLTHDDNQPLPASSVLQAMLAA